MTKQDAKDAMKKGKKVSHRYFLPDEWMKSSSDGEIYTFEDGVTETCDEFWLRRNGVHQWDTDWQIVE